MKVHLHLGIHENPYAGMFQYGRSLVEGLHHLSPQTSVAATVVSNDPRVVSELHDVGMKTLYVKKTVLFRQWYAFSEPLLSHLPQGADIVHGISNFVPTRNRSKKVLTIHDLIQAYPVERPRSFSRSCYITMRSALYKATFAQAARSVDAILTIHPEQKRLIEDLLSPRAPVTVAYTPLPKEFLSVESHLPPKEPRSVVVLASKDMRKNIEAAARALSACCDDVGTISVVLAHRDLRPWAQSLPWPSSIPVQYFVEPSHTELKEIFLSSEVLLFPSIAEGLGLPIFQAILTQTKVVCCKDFLVPEVVSLVGEGIFDCEPQSDASIAEALKRALSYQQSPKLFDAMGEVVRRHFSAEALAKTTLDIYGALV